MTEWNVTMAHQHPDSFNMLLTTDKGSRQLTRVEAKDGDTKAALEILAAGKGEPLEIEKMTGDEFHDELAAYMWTIAGTVVHADQFMCPDTMVTVMRAEVKYRDKTQHVTVGGLPEMNGYVPRLAFNRMLEALKFNLLGPSA